MSNGTQSVGPSTPQSSVPTDATSARFALPATEFAFAPVFERVSDARVTLEPAVANPADHALLVVRMDECDRPAVESALEADPAVGGVEAFGTHENGRRYRVTWDGRARRLVRYLTDEGVTVLSAQGLSGRWKFRLLAGERGTVSRAYDSLDDRGYEPDCLSVTTFDGEQASLDEMSDQQHETLVAAFETGYYDVPRNATSTELADQLGISHQALSERFRRAHKQLVERKLIVE